MNLSDVTDRSVAAIQEAGRELVTAFPTLDWRIELRCGHAYQVEFAPNLRQEPVRICAACGEMAMIIKAEYVQAFVKGGE